MNKVKIDPVEILGKPPLGAENFTWSGATKDPRRDGFASAEQAARFLDVSRAMITKLTASGDIPHRRFGRSLRIPWNWLLDQVEQASHS